jgi:hypothetical protein
MMLKTGRIDPSRQGPSEPEPTDKQRAQLARVAKKIAQTEIKKSKSSSR